MGYRQTLERAIEKKTQEIEQLKASLLAADNFLAGLQESLRLLPREPGEAGSETSIRDGSVVAKARDLIRSKGRPMHIDEILVGLGKPGDKKNRASVAGSIAGYARRGEVFIKTKPNTFGLFGMSVPKEDAVPADFGSESPPDGDDADSL